MASIVGTPNPDTLNGGAEDDLIEGLDGADTLGGLEGRDTLDGGGGDDRLDGGDGADRLIGGAGRDILMGGEGDDAIVASLTAANIDGGGGADFISLQGLNAGETVALGAVFRGGDGDDSFSGQRRIYATPGLTLDGGDGVDSFGLFENVSNTPPTPQPRIEIYLNQAQPAETGLTLMNFEKIGLLGVAASIHGSEIGETIDVSEFSDSVLGGGGNDRIAGDQIFRDIRGRLIEAGGDDTLMGGTGNDTISEHWGSNYIRGEEGNDSLQGGGQFDDVHGNTGDDTVRGGGGGDWVVGGKDQDQLFGEFGDDIVYGNLGADTADGGSGADTVRGGQGDDVVAGGDGADFVAGDLGSDTVTGGAGADVFHTHAAAGLDRVTDFNPADGDRVNLLPGTAYSLSQQGADTLIDMGGGNQMILVGVTLSSLPDGWIFGAA